MPLLLRLCDVVDTARLWIQAPSTIPISTNRLRSAGLWEWLATYLVHVSGYVRHTGRISSPAIAGNHAAHLAMNWLFQAKFLRIPIFPQAASLCSEWKRLLLNGDLRSTYGLSLSPAWLRSGSGIKITGSDKGSVTSEALHLGSRGFTDIADLR